MDLEENSKFGAEVVKEERNLKPQTLSTSKAIRANVNGDTCTEEDPNHKFSSESDVADRFGAVERARFSDETIRSPQAVETQIGDGIGMNDAKNSSRTAGHSPSGSVVGEGTTPSPEKGYGLKKWRRMRRDSSKNGASVADYAQFLKRRHSITEIPVSREENKLKSMVEVEADDSVASSESRNAAITSFPIGIGVLDPELEVLAYSGFSIGMDSDNSEDHTSKLSMVGSAPKMRHDAHGFGRKRSRVKNFGGRGPSQVLQQRGQRRGGAVDASKKHKEDKAILEKENSHSSVESDLRSSAAGVLHQGSVVSSNGVHSDLSLNFGGDHSDEAQSRGDIRSNYCKENEGMQILVKEGLNDEMLEEGPQGRDNPLLPSDLDPLMESIMLLQEAKELLVNGPPSDVVSTSASPLPVDDIPTIVSSISDGVVLHKSSRVIHQPTYLKDYQCNLLDGSSTHVSTSTSYPISKYISYHGLSDSHKQFVINVSCSQVEPQYYHQAMKFPEWRLSMHEELQAMEANNT